MPSYSPSLTTQGLREIRSEPFDGERHVYSPKPLFRELWFGELGPWGGEVRVVVSVSTSRSRDGLETYQRLVSVSSRPNFQTSRSREATSLVSAVKVDWLNTIMLSKFPVVSWHRHQCHHSSLDVPRSLSRH